MKIVLAVQLCLLLSTSVNILFKLRLLLGIHKYPRTQFDMQMQGNTLDLSTTAFHKKLESGLTMRPSFGVQMLEKHPMFSWPASHKVNSENNILPSLMGRLLKGFISTDTLLIYSTINHSGKNLVSENDMSPLPFGIRQA